MMILAIDVGNTNIVAGCIGDNKILFNERISTNPNLTDLEYAVQLKTIFEIHSIDCAVLEGAVMSSVVPPLTAVFRAAVRKLTGLETLVVGPGIKTGLRIKIDNPAQLGSDLVVDAVAGVNFYSCPFIVIDMGTATTMSVVDKNGDYVGGTIIPGLRTSLDALTSRAAQLGNVDLTLPERVIGRNTADCLRSGILNYTAAGIDGMIDRMQDELGEKCTVISTGGLAGLVTPLCRREIVYDKDLLLKGLTIIYEKNRGSGTF